jgi:cytochrome P450
MRLSPPVPTTLWRELPVGDNGSKQPLIIDGHTVPAGTWVGVNTYTIHHNEEYFPDPFAFRPERWLADSSDASYKSPHMQAAFSPFGVGSRSCAGKAMAYMEMSLVIAKTVWYFDFERVRGDRLDRIGEGKKGDRYGRGRVEKYQLYDQFVATHEGPYLRFRPRDGVCRDLE